MIYKNQPPFIIQGNLTNHLFSFTDPPHIHKMKLLVQQKIIFKFLKIQPNFVPSIQMLKNLKRSILLHHTTMCVKVLHG